MSGNGAKHTQKRLPVKLVYVEYYEHVHLAFRREKQIQNWSHKKKTALISMDYVKLHLLAECRNDSHYKNHMKEGDNLG
jgi:putative endonuclease